MPLGAADRLPRPEVDLDQRGHLGHRVQPLVLDVGEQVHAVGARLARHDAARADQVRRLGRGKVQFAVLLRPERPAVFDGRVRRLDQLRVVLELRAHLRVRRLELKVGPPLQPIPSYQ